MKSRHALIVLLVLSSTLAGCSLPEVKLKDALLTKLTTKNLEIGLNMEIFNPNEYSIPLSGVDWDLDLFRSDFTTGETGFTRNIPGNRRADVQVPIGIAFQTVRAGVQNLLTKREIPWKIGGGCSFRIPASEPVRVGFQQAGAWTNPLMR